MPPAGLARASPEATDAAPKRLISVRLICGLLFDRRPGFNSYPGQTFLQAPTAQDTGHGSRTLQRPEREKTHWQKIWEDKRTFLTSKGRAEYYVLEMFPYPSGRIHVGHVRNYVTGDAVGARYKAGQGFQRAAIRSAGTRSGLPPRRGHEGSASALRD